MALSGVEYWEGCPLLSRLEGLMEHCELSQWSKRILTYFEGHRTLLFTYMPML